MLTPAFHFQILESFFDVFNEQSKNLIADFHRSVAENNSRAVNVYTILTQCALDIICGWPLFFPYFLRFSPALRSKFTRSLKIHVPYRLVDGPPGEEARRDQGLPALRQQVTGTFFGCVSLERKTQRGRYWVSRLRHALRPSARSGLPEITKRLPI